MPCSTDHPRRCGENITAPDELGNVLGSPPQVRGKHKSVLPYGFGDGITPAGAGKTSSKTTGIHSCRDHPRRCGENFFSGKLDSDFPGSPPQVRGKLECEYYDTHTPGITPAGAGKTTHTPPVKARL